MATLARIRMEQGTPSEGKSPSSANYPLPPTPTGEGYCLKGGRCYPLHNVIGCHNTYKL